MRVFIFRSTPSCCWHTGCLRFEARRNQSLNVEIKKTDMAQRIENSELRKSLGGMRRGNPARWSLLCRSTPDRRQGQTAQGAERGRKANFAGFVEILIVAGFFSAASAFLLKLAYLGVMAATGIGGVLLLTFSIYLRKRFGEKIPTRFLFLLLGAIEVDALGNYFHLYGKPFGPLQYDEFAHMLCSALVTPGIVWILQSSAKRGGYRLPLGLITILAVAMIFSLCGFYEIIELWDERYFHGKRIWGPYDTSNDLQQDLIGTLAGAALAYALLRPKASTANQSDCLAQSRPNL